MILSLNLQGYIKDKGIWTERIFFFPFIAKYSDPGRIFDPESLTNLIPTVIHVAVIINLNNAYQGIAHWLTDNENPRTKQDYENAVVLKRFFFESFDCYIALFYLAFFQFDTIRLRMELVGMYTTDSIRRVFLETIVPALLSWFNSYGKKDAISKLNAKSNKSGKHMDAVAAEGYQEFQLPEYEQFDDYLEMVIEFGYVTMFAASFPLGCALSFFCNLIELKSDTYKVCFVTQRPEATRVNSIGVWIDILQAQAVLAVLTNVLLFGFASEQMATWLPNMFRGVDSEAVEGSGRYVVMIVFAIEHIVILIALALNAFYPDRPEWVDNESKRLRYNKDSAARKLRKAFNKDAAGRRDGRKAGKGRGPKDRPPVIL